MTDKLPMTIERLNNIKLGEKIVYYKGCFESDIFWSKGAPKYGAILSHVKRTAESLSHKGIVALYEKNIEVSSVVKGRYRIGIKEYSALGLV